MCCNCHHYTIITKVIKNDTHKIPCRGFLCPPLTTDPSWDDDFSVLQRSILRKRTPQLLTKIGMYCNCHHYTMSQKSPGSSIDPSWAGGCPESWLGEFQNTQMFALGCHIILDFTVKKPCKDNTTYHMSLPNWLPYVITKFGK